MEYGKYKITLSIGYSGADREDEIDIAEYYDRETWDKLTDTEQEEFVEETTVDLLRCYVEYGYQLIG